jgi:hypothetical protein
MAEYGSLMETLLPGKVSVLLERAEAELDEDDLKVWLDDPRNHQMKALYRLNRKENKAQARIERKYNVVSAASRWQTKLKKSKSNDCIQWRGALNRYGKGTFYADGKTYDHQEYAWLLEHGTLPPSSLKTTCTTKGCVNVEHLMPTEVRARKRKQQALQAEEVQAIRRRYDSGESVIDIKEDYRGISEQSIRNAALRKTYQWVPETEDEGE